MIKTAVIGASGFVGRHILKNQREHFADVVGTAFSSPQNDLTQFDIREPDLAKLRLLESNHEAVVISSAKANVGYCEQNPKESYEVNVSGTLELVRQISRTKMKVIFLSTDYVFDGRQGGYGDQAQICPNTEYGRQKAHVERELPKITDNFLILRLSKIYGLTKGDNTLIDEIMQKLHSGTRIQAAKDQIFAPAAVDDLVKMLHLAQDAKRTGILNSSGPKAFSRFDIASMCAQKLGKGTELIDPINLHQLPGMIGRPLNTSLTPSALFLPPLLKQRDVSSSVEQLAVAWNTHHSK